MVFQSFLNFDTFLFPKLTTIIYWIGILLIVIAGLGGIVGAIATENWIGILGALIFAAVALVIWRITVELWMVIFSIYDVLRDIRDGRRG